MNKNDIDLPIKSKQQQASNPQNSVWVNASAGTGKTTILIKRILRLLIDGVPMKHILCLTFTKTAAEEMKKRLFKILTEWAICNNNQLHKELKELLNQEPSPSNISCARGLFHYLINYQEDIHIQTIHSFCQELLSQFPLEANLNPNFGIIDDALKSQLQTQAIEDTLTRYYHTIDTQHKIDDLFVDNHIDLKILINNLTSYQFEDIISKCLTNNQILDNLALLEQKYRYFNQSINQLKQDFLQQFYNTKKLNPQQILTDYLTNIDINSFKKLIQLCQEKFIDSKEWQDMQQYLNYSIDAQIRHFDTWYNIFLTASKTIRSKQRFTQKKYNHKNFLQNDFQWISELMHQEAETVHQVLKEYENQCYGNLVSELNALLYEIYHCYQELKSYYNTLDYNDLILYTVNLLNNSFTADWIKYKLDTKFAHILLDEAQDTGHLSWQIIKILAEDSFAGQSAKETNVSIFVVGDIKQSIYAFSGVDPLAYSHAKTFLEHKIQNSQHDFYNISMNTSFRSAGAIIELINCVIVNLFNTQQAPYIDQQLQHLGYVSNQDLTSIVEIWPPLVDPELHHEHIANKIVDKIIILTQQGVQYKDILILYRKRKSKTVARLIQLLKENNIPISGLDKFNLTDNLVIKDLISLVKWLVEPQDNFALACILKSPMFNLQDSDLSHLILNQVSTTNLLNTLSKDQNYQLIYSILTRWQHLAKELDLFQLFFQILYNDKYMMKFIKALGRDTQEYISEFMNTILNFQDISPNANLISFLNFLNQNNTEIKRDIDNTQNYVSLMTIHLAKGLESKIVFLLAEHEAKKPANNLLTNKDSKHPFIFIKNNLHNPHCEKLILQEHQNQQEEEKRILYVALTRAKQQLYICNHGTKLPNEENSWYHYITSNLSDKFVKCENDFFNHEYFVSNQVLKYAIDNQDEISTSQQSSILDKSDATEYELPLWISVQPLQEEKLALPIIPSNIDFDNKYSNSPLNHIQGSGKRSVNIGLITHKILEQITKTPHLEQQLNLMHSILHYSKLESATNQHIINMVTNLLHNQEFQFIFQSTGYNEVNISGILDQEKDSPKIIAGRIDRLLINENEIIIIEYKSSSYTERLHPYYQQQIAYYQQILQQIYPDKQITGYILYLLDCTLRS